MENPRGIQDQLNEILTLLRGNTLDTTDKGMAGIQNDHDIRIGKLEKFRDKAVWTVIGMGLPAGWGAIDIISKIFIKH